MVARGVSKGLGYHSDHRTVIHRRTRPMDHDLCLVKSDGHYRHEVASAAFSQVVREVLEWLL